MAELLTNKQFQQAVINRIYTLNISTLRSYPIVIYTGIFRGSDRLYLLVRNI